MSSVRTAVILGAGMGTRLEERGKTKPKGFIELGERPIVEESILKLMDVSLERIIVVTGHCSEFYEELGARFPNVETIKNEHYSSSGSMYSLYCARELVNGDFLLLESDIIYERQALQFLLELPESDAILLSGETLSGDEVYVETRGGCLLDMSKDRSSLGEEVSGELVGITKVSVPLFERMLEVAARQFESSLHVDYETDCLVAAGRDYDIFCPVIDNLLWAEIDDKSHLVRAENQIYPAIVRRDGPI